MARLRQQFAQNYGSSANINAEIENIVRYVNAAELGNNTIAELIRVLFNDDGEFIGPIDLRLDTTNGLQYRVGTYEDDDDGWQTIANIADIRGPAGQNFATIEGPFFYNRQDYIADGGETSLSYTFDESTDEIVVYINGLLQAETGVYTPDEANSQVDFDSALSASDAVTIYSVRVNSVADYRRSDTLSTTNQAVFPFVHTADERLLVFVNGLLQREGGAYDYTTNPASDTITFTSGQSLNDLITIITVDNQTITNVGGLMLEDDYTDSNGLIPYAKLAIADAAIPQAKVNGLAAGLAAKPDVYVQGTSPVSPNSGDLWLNTGVTPNTLYFYDGATWLRTSPDSALPNFTASNANQWLGVNSNGTALVYADIDFSALVPKTYMGAANGVASLDSNGRLPSGQLPEIFSQMTLPFFSVWEDGASAIANGTYHVGNIYKQRFRIDGMTYKLSSGTCTIQLSVDGTPVGDTYNVSSTRSNSSFVTTIEVDASATGRRLELVVTNNVSGNDLEVGISGATLAV